MKPARWRRKVRNWITGPMLYELVRDGVSIATVQECQGGWFWYGAGANSLRNGGKPTDLESAKRDANEHVLRATEAS